MLSKNFTSNYDLARYATELNLPVVAIVYKDDLYKLPNRYGGFILNSDDIGNAGKHWISFFVPKNGKYSYYMDSYGIYPPEAVKAYSKRMGKVDIIFNTKQIQTLRSGYCGSYCLLFLYYMQKKKGSYKDRFNKYLNLFKENNTNNI